MKSLTRRWLRWIPPVSALIPAACAAAATGVAVALGHADPAAFVIVAAVLAFEGDER